MYADEAVFRRTAAGQREMLIQSAPLSPHARRFLAVVNGHTALRPLLDLGFGSEPMRQHIEQLVERGLIALCTEDDLVSVFPSSRF
ncbi:hypothetical protein AAW51_4846 [Caldimonas brevitalea]|uniref:Uncharacterized protein n=2 Tax=Caldimonas brevitalea TaxID=413882 RepID=A0A0G3BQ40_9BURK|nr:hypothetical protein AAW51_4846 [Caldimonas brevitalea]